MVMAMEGSTMTATETATETAIAGTAAMEGSKATGRAKKSTVCKGLTAMATAVECLTAAAMKTTIDGSTCN